MDLTIQIEQAFSDRKYPGDENITHCSYDMKHGGEYDAPCWECVEIADFFCGKRWQEITASELFINGQADSLLTVDAYCYLLPAFLIAAVKEPDELDVCIDHLTYRFGPKLEESWKLERLTKVFEQLTRSELRAVLGYFRYASELEEDFDGYSARSIENLENVLQKP